MQKVPHNLKRYLSYDPDTGLFTWIERRSGVKAGCAAGWHTSHGYIQIELDGGRYMAHRLAWLYMHGTWPAEQIDHINRVRDDNRIANLRCVSPQQNLWNLSPRKTKASATGYTGVYQYKRHGGHFYAEVRYLKAKIYICSKFKTALEAHEARQAKLAELRIM